MILIPLISFSQLSESDTEFLRLELSDKINNLRLSKGLKPLLFNDTLRKAAVFHSEYMAVNNILSHDEKQNKYANPKKRVLAFQGNDFEIVGENILYSTLQKTQFNKKDIIALSEEMFTSWKNSPGHYANMIEPEYVFGDLGFKTNQKKNHIYVTQVFGTKGYVVQNQISNNSFNLVPAPKDCEKEFEGYENLLMNMGNNLKIVGNEVILYYHDISFFQNFLSEPNDGIAIDLISKDQLECGKPNHLDLSPVYDGILLKPYYSTEILSNNRAESSYRIVAKVGEIPKKLQSKDYSPSLILIKDGKVCKYLYPAYVPRNAYALRQIEPIINDEEMVELVYEGVVNTQIINYDFKTNITKPINPPQIERIDEEIHSIRIKSFSSVEGSSTNNEELHNSRANFIQKQIISTLEVSKDLFIIDAKENWDQMDFQLNYFNRNDLAKLSHDSLKSILANKEILLPWDSLLFSQRKSIATINYLGNYVEGENRETLGEFNLRTAVATENTLLVNKALYHMYLSQEYDPAILFEPQIIEYIKTHPKTVGNYTALLSTDYYHAPYVISQFIYSWLNRIEKLDMDARYNILHLYTLIGSYFLNNWDVSAKRLSNVLHPLKIEEFSDKTIKSELLLNLHLTFIQYFGQINDGPNIAKSFYFIADYFKNQSLKNEDDVDLALFFNKWSMYHLTLKHLLPRFEKKNINEDGLFVLAATMNYTNYNDESGVYLNINQEALKLNQLRWCEWIKADFQVKRNYQIKRMYCESCK